MANYFLTDADLKRLEAILATKAPLKDIIADDIKSGVFPLERGGTGATTVEEILELLGITKTTDDIKSGVFPIERGGTGADNAEQARKNLGIDKYQVPWNVDEDVGQILLEPFELSCTAKGYNVLNTETFAFKFINSGIVRIAFTHYFMHSHVDGYDPDKTYINLCLNDKVIKTIKFVEPDDPIDVAYDLAVKKGDIFKIEISAYCKGSGDSDTVKVVIGNFMLYANIATAYKYLTLSENLDSAMTAEILNTK